MRIFITTALSVIFSIFIWSDSASASPSTVDTSTTVQATFNSSQRKVFFDSLNEVHWAFYYNGSAIEYSYSSDAESWTSAGTLAYDTPSFAAIYKTIGGISYVFVVAEANNYDVVLRRGTLGSSSITFDGAITALDGTADDDKYTKPTVALSENNHLWISGIKDYGVRKLQRFQAIVRRSTNIAVADLSVFNAVTKLGWQVRELRSAVILPQNADSMYLVTSTDGTNIVGYVFDGATWSAGNSGGDYSWFGITGSGFDVDHHLSIARVYVIAVSGSDVYVGGNFTAVAGNTRMKYIAHWDGATWKPMGTGLSGSVSAIAVADSGVYVGGSFADAGGVADADGVARWDGTNWNALGTGFASGGVGAFAVSGSDIYVGGSFTDAGGIAEADRFARWDGTSWSALGTGLASGSVGAIAVSGSDVYVGGTFTDAGGIAEADRVARWDGASWNALGTGLSSNVNAIAVSGSDVYVGGAFVDAGGVADADKIARWDGANWNALGLGLSSTVSTIGISGSDVYVGGDFTNAGAVAEADNVARWDGANWNALGNGLNGAVSSLSVSGTDVYVGGDFYGGGAASDANMVGKWDGSNWSGFEYGGINGQIDEILVVGSDIYFAGSFANAAGIEEADCIVRWDGSDWYPLGSGLNSNVAAMAAAANGDIYVGGFFTDAGGVAAADRIARWDGSNWSAVGSGISNSVVLAISISGSDVYVGGGFINAGGNGSADRIARWNIDDNTWYGLSTGVSSSVYAIAISGADVYIGGVFLNAGSANGDRIVRWDGGAWNALGTGLPGTVYSIAVDDGDVYVGGTFADAGGIADADGIARWDGANWNALGTGVTPCYFSRRVDSIYISNDDVYIAGCFNSAGGVANTGQIARWDGANWNAVGDGMYRVDPDGPMSSIAEFQGDLYFGGFLSIVNGTNITTSLARYSRAIATDATTSTEISALSDPNGDIHLSYTNEDGEVRFRSYDDDTSAWQTTVDLNATSSSSPTLSRKSDTGRLVASWIEDNDVKYSHALSPYEVGDWSAAATLYSAGTNANLSGAADIGSDLHPLIWTNGAGAPYSVLSGVINMGAPIISISSTASSATSITPIPVTIQFSNDVVGFVVGEIAVTNGTVGNFVAVDGDTYTVDITPSAQGIVTVNVAGAVAKDEFDNDNLAAAQFSITYDSISPTVALSSTSISPTQNSEIPITIEFNEPVIGFAVGDLTLVNATASNFVAVDAGTYTVKLTATADGNVKVTVPAGVATDTATNPNTVSTTLTIRYKDPNLDSDEDGVADVQEEIDETNPQDSGSYLAVLPTSWCSDWNGFFGMFNINEYVNLKNSKRVVVSTIFDTEGEAKSAMGLDLIASAQTDLLVHDMPGWTNDSYGKLCSEASGSPGDVDGRMVYYKPNSTGYDFAFTLPYYDGLTGRQYLPFNTYQPSSDPADAGNLVTNWVQLSNLENSKQKGRLIFYAQDGTVLSEQAVSLEAESRQDFLAHSPGASLAGLVEWRPNSSTAKFRIRNARYYYDNAGNVDSFDAALQLEGSRGNGEPISTLLDTRSQTAILEVANTTSSAITVAVKIHDASGVLRNQQSLSLDPYATHHIEANEYLNNELGSATLDGSVVGSVLAAGMHYGRDSLGGITHVYGIIAKQALGTITNGSYNTYLGQGCELLLVNSTNSSVTSTIRMKRLDGTSIVAGESITVPAYGTIAYDACAHDEAQQYGVVTVESATKNALKAVVTRYGANGDYRFVTPVR